MSRPKNHSGVGATFTESLEDLAADSPSAWHGPMKPVDERHVPTIFRVHLAGRGLRRTAVSTSAVPSKMGITQQAASARLARAEQALGVRLVA